MPLLILLILLQMMSLPPLISPAYAVDISLDLEGADAGPVIFKYQDSQFNQVYITASFTDWVRIPLDLEGDEWVLAYEAPPGRHYYRFVVFEGDDVWEAIDPHNSQAIHHSDHGWVSVLEIDEDFAYQIDDEEDEERITPQVVFYASGETTVGAINVRRRDDGELLWRIEWDLLGRFALLRRGEAEEE